jgi:cell division GTPase FtsZ
MIFSEQSVNASQYDELTEEYFKREGLIRLDKNDLWQVLSGKGCVLITARQEDENPTEFIHQLITHLNSKPNKAQWRRLLIYFGQSPKAHLKMEDMSLLEEFLNHSISDYIDVIWGIHHNPDEVGLTAVILYSLQY